MHTRRPCFTTWSFCIHHPALPSVTVIEARELLGTFDTSLREYAARKLVSRGVRLRRVRARTSAHQLAQRKMWVGESGGQARSQLMDTGLCINVCVCVCVHAKKTV
jgi:hypothetical protein